VASSALHSTARRLCTVLLPGEVKTLSGYCFSSAPAPAGSQQLVSIVGATSCPAAIGSVLLHSRVYSSQLRPLACARTHLRQRMTCWDFLSCPARDVDCPAPGELPIEMVPASVELQPPGSHLPNRWNRAANPTRNVLARHSLFDMSLGLGVWLQMLLASLLCLLHLHGCYNSSHRCASALLSVPTYVQHDILFLKAFRPSNAQHDQCDALA